ncbi:NUDIX hydrolase [soil metagenome]
MFTIAENRLKVALITRGQPPFRGALALPGGFVKPDEDLKAAAFRELAEETRLSPGAIPLTQFAVYGKPGRDPRMRVVSVGYWAIMPDLPSPKGGSDAATAQLIPVDEALREGSMAFDHVQILSDALETARRAIETTTIGTRFCDADGFTVSELRKTYETVWGVTLDQGNFQKKVIDAAGFVVPTGRRREGGKGRPPELYVTGPSSVIEPPLRRPGPSTVEEGGG